MDDQFGFLPWDYVSATSLVPGDVMLKTTFDPNGADGERETYNAKLIVSVDKIGKKVLTFTLNEDGYTLTRTEFPKNTDILIIAKAKR